MAVKQQIASHKKKVLLFRPWDLVRLFGLTLFQDFANLQKLLVFKELLLLGSFG